MYVESVPNRNSPPATLLRESFRDGGQVRKRTLANISDWPPAQVESLRRVLKGETFPTDGDNLNIIRSLPHGHVAAVVGTIRKLGLPQLLDATRSPDRDLSVPAWGGVRVLSAARALLPGRPPSPRGAARCLLNLPPKVCRSPILCIT